MMGNKILLAGPWVGEFGWELFCWQAYIRWLSQQYNKTIVISRKGHEFLYEDFVDEYYSFEAPPSKANMFIGEVNQMELMKIVSNVKHTHHLKHFNIGFNIIKNNDFAGSDRFNNQQKFIKYKSDTLNKSFDIILHPRYKSVGSNRNWTKEKFQILINKLVEVGYNIATIGTNEAFDLENVSDFRNVSIKDTVSLMNRCKLVVGQSSGPMHLASLSGVPHFVWSDETNRLRYNKYWNPHKTTCHFYTNGGWNPKVDDIFAEIKNILK